MNEIMSFSDVKKFYKRKGIFGELIVRALNGISFSIPEGSITSIVGESGSGKSTIAMISSFLENPTSGRLYFKGRIIDNSVNKYLLWREVQIVFQDPGRVLNPKKSIDFLLKEPFLNYSICSKKEMGAKIDSLLEELSINRDLKYKKPFELSGGEKQKITIARALSLSPSFLILDEPFSYVDVITGVQILDFLLEFRKKRKMTFLFISHDLNTIKNCSDYIVILYKGLIMESGVAEILDHPFHPYTKFLISPKIAGNYEKEDQGCPFSSRCAFKINACFHQPPVLKFIDGRYIRCHLY